MTALSYKNPTVQHLRRLIGRRSARHGEQLFVVDGPTLTREAVDAGLECLAQFVPEHSDAGVDGAGPVHELAAGVFERVADTESPQPPITVVRMPEVDVVAALPRAQFVVALQRVSDPGNVGTILRSAEAAGADLVVLSPGCTDAFGPKTVRASAGSVFRVPVVVSSPEALRRAGLRTIGTSSHDGAGRTVRPHDETDFAGRVAVVLGNEAAGLPDEWTDDVGPIDEWTTIRQVGCGESLNVAMAATVLAFEAARQRRV